MAADWSIASLHMSKENLEAISQEEVNLQEVEEPQE